jgi:DNA polymerase III subunit chi
MDIQFYHLLTTPLEVALPKLASKAYERGIRVCIVAEEAMCATLDAALWTYQPNSFLPHGVEDAHAADHPILLAASPSQANDATLLMVTNGLAVPPEVTPYDRVFDIFNGNDDGAVAAARTRWKTYLDTGTPLTYIKQRANGGWETLQEANKPLKPSEPETHAD